MQEEPATRATLTPVDEHEEIYNNTYLSSQTHLGNVLEELFLWLAQPPPAAIPQRIPRAQPQAPDPFDGTDPQLLDTFILQCLSNSSKPPFLLAETLGSDGKLNEAERKFCFDNMLCLFCGLAGHKVNVCRKRLAADQKVKGRAAEAASPTAVAGKE